MALKEYKPEKLLYTMGEVTEMFDVKPSLIRFWEQRFDILKPKKNKKGNRLFTPADIKNLEIIYHLTKERGMTLAGVEKYLKNSREDAERETEIVRRLQTIRSLLVEIREELKEDPKDEIRVFSATPSTEPEPATSRKPEPEKESTETEEEIIVSEIILEESEPEFPAEVAEAGKHCPVKTAIDRFFEQTDEPQEQPEEETADPEEELIDAEVTVPFTAQPLFELEDAFTQPETEEETEVGETPEEIKASAIDTQQSLF